MSSSKRASLARRRKISERLYLKKEASEKDILSQLAVIREQPEAYIHSYRMRLAHGVLYSTDEKDATAHRMLLVLQAADVQGLEVLINVYLSLLEQAFPIFLSEGRKEDVDLLLQSVVELGLPDEVDFFERYLAHLTSQSRFGIQELLEHLSSVSSRIL